MVFVIVTCINELNSQHKVFFNLLLFFLISFHTFLCSWNFTIHTPSIIKNYRLKGLILLVTFIIQQFLIELLKLILLINKYESFSSLDFKLLFHCLNQLDSSFINFMNFSYKVLIFCLSIYCVQLYIFLLYPRFFYPNTKLFNKIHCLLHVLFLLRILKSKFFGGIIIFINPKCILPISFRLNSNSLNTCLL